MSKLRPVTPISIIAALLSDVMSDSSMSISKNSKVWKDLERAKDLANGLDQEEFLLILSLIHI